MVSTPSIIPLASSSAGRVSGKAWKPLKSPTVRSHLQEGLKTKNWDLRMQMTQKKLAVKKLQEELRQEKDEELQRKREITKQRRQFAEEKKRMEDMKTQMGARKAARLRKKAGRTKKISH